MKVINSMTDFGEEGFVAFLHAAIERLLEGEGVPDESCVADNTVYSRRQPGAI